jgi:hypothetical protein
VLEDDAPLARVLGQSKLFHLRAHLVHVPAKEARGLGHRPGCPAHLQTLKKGSNLSVTGRTMKTIRPGVFLAMASEENQEPSRFEASSTSDAVLPIRERTSAESLTRSAMLIEVTKRLIISTQNCHLNGRD